MADFRGDLSCNQNALKEPVLDPLDDFPTSPVESQMFFHKVNKFLYYFDGDNWVRVNGRSNVPYDYILLQDQKTSGTAGNNYASGAWRKMDLNTIAYDDTGSVTVTSNNFTLPAGSYEINASSPLVTTGSTSYKFRMRLYNETDASVVVYGQSYISSSPLIGKFSITTSKTLSIYLYPAGSLMTNSPSSITGIPEIYTQVELRKVV